MDITSLNQLRGGLVPMRIEMPLGCGFSPSVVLSQWEKGWALPENLFKFLLQNGAFCAL